MKMISHQTAQQIVDTVNEVCQKNINFINTQGIIIASTDSSRLNTFHEIGYQAILRQTVIEVYEDDHFPGTRKGINIPIYHNQQIVAAIGISGEVESARKYAHLAQKITSILLRERDLGIFENQKQNRLNYIIRSLTRGKSLEPALLEEFLSDNHLSKELHYRVIVVKTVSAASLESISPSQNETLSVQDEIVQSFRQSGSNLYAYHYPDEYVLLIKNNQLDLTYSAMQSLSDILSQPITIGIGNSVLFPDLSQSYQAAKLAIHTHTSERGIVFYDDLGYELLLSNIEESARKHFLEKTIASLGPSECSLLEVYYIQGMSLQKTCEYLHMHKNTVQYQLNRIHQLCGYNPREFKDAVILYSALLLSRK